MIDVIVVGAGPAGSIAALVLARAGAQVWLLEREAMPRPKLCGDTLNPGAVAALADLGLTGGPLADALALDGMLITGPQVALRARYPAGQVGRAIARGPLDAWLAEAAVAAGARLECDVRVRGPLWRDGRTGAPSVAGVLLAADDRRAIRVPAAVTIAADGRRSVLARAAKLSAHPSTPRRWAFGVYASGVRGLSTMGEMHVRRGHYIGVAPVGDGRANVCVVTGVRPAGVTPIELIARALARDPQLRERTEGWRAEGRPRVLGPLAVDCVRAGMPGLLLAGDAAGFIDPMTGDGIHLAIRGGAMAAAAALEALESGDTDRAATDLTARRAAALGTKLRFNRLMRALVGSTLALELAGVGARIAPAVLRRLVCVAGDVPSNRAESEGAA
ncbi:MAG: NAD(P)/FAD-dependent oxidoreductase [Acidobacteria bacterium]|nr:NAD(P)/FAD-dependent oxidoreductase [Acidobacteriota bacterium]